MYSNITFPITSFVRLIPSNTQTELPHFFKYNWLSKNIVTHPLEKVPKKKKTTQQSLHMTLTWYLFDENQNGEGAAISTTPWDLLCAVSCVPVLLENRMHFDENCCTVVV